MPGRRCALLLFVVVASTPSCLYERTSVCGAHALYNGIECVAPEPSCGDGGLANGERCNDHTPVNRDDCEPNCAVTVYTSNGVYPVISSFDRDVITTSSSDPIDTLIDLEQVSSPGSPGTTAANDQRRGDSFNGTPYAHHTFSVVANPGLGYQYAAMRLGLTSHSDISDYRFLELRLRGSIEGGPGWVIVRLKSDASCDLEMSDVLVPIDTAWRCVTVDLRSELVVHPAACGAFDARSAAALEIVNTDPPARGHIDLDDVVLTNTRSCPPSTLLARPVSANSDDSLEVAGGSRAGMNIPGVDELTLTRDTALNRSFVAGLRFTGLQISQGSVIATAHIQFTSSSDQVGSTNLTIRGEQSDNALPFSSADFDITSRPHSGAAVVWNNVPSWSVDRASADERTPDVSEVLQQVVDRPGWSPGNSVVFVLEGEGTRTAFSVDGSACQRAVLVLRLE